MKYLLLTASFLFISCSCKLGKKDKSNRFTQEEILHQLDLAFKGIPNEYYPTARPQDIKYNFFLDLEHGFFETAGSRIDLYADSTRWAVVFEKSGHQDMVEIWLDYVGNCINYIVEKSTDKNYVYISNCDYVNLMAVEECERIENKEKGRFELISPVASEITFHGQKVKIEHDLNKYLALGIIPRGFDNPQKLISFTDLVRFLSDTRPDLVAATEDEIKQHIPSDIPKLMSIDKFHYGSIYDDKNLPSKQEMYQLIAKILVTRDTTLWKPKLKPNNHWSNWVSGNL